MAGLSMYPQDRHQRASSWLLFSILVAPLTLMVFPIGTNSSLSDSMFSGVLVCPSKVFAVSLLRLIRYRCGQSIDFSVVTFRMLAIKGCKTGRQATVTPIFSSRLRRMSAGLSVTEWVQDATLTGPKFRPGHNHLSLCQFLRLHRHTLILMDTDR